jgi:endonuclease/exonuclease/phosphatase family metal-dependent hydrolase
VGASAVIASYNTHGGVGLDFRFAPRRVARVVLELQADIIALQELTTRAAGFDMLEELRLDTGYHAIAGPTLQRGASGFGNGLLTRCPVVSVARIKLDVARREPRGAIDAVLDCHGAPLRVIATHLGLSPAERHEQIGRLLDVIRAGPDMPTVLLGDLNEWFLRRRSLRWLHEHFGESPACATFPSPLPMLALDRIWIAPAAALRRVRVHKSLRARIASDHLPLVADISWQPGGEPVRMRAA